MTEKKKRGFAAMTPEERAALGAKGGRAAHESGGAHSWTHEEAKAAGRKGGLATKAAKGWKDAKPAAEG